MSSQITEFIPYSESRWAELAKDPLFRELCEINQKNWQKEKKEIEDKKRMENEWLSIAAASILDGAVNVLESKFQPILHTRFKMYYYWIIPVPDHPYSFIVHGRPLPWKSNPLELDGIVYHPLIHGLDFSKARLKNIGSDFGRYHSDVYDSLGQLCLDAAVKYTDSRTKAEHKACQVLYGEGDENQPLLPLLPLIHIIQAYATDLVF